MSPARHAMSSLSGMRAMLMVEPMMCIKRSSSLSAFAGTTGVVDGGAITWEDVLGVRERVPTLPLSTRVWASPGEAPVTWFTTGL